MTQLSAIQQESPKPVPEVTWEQLDSPSWLLNKNQDDSNNNNVAPNLDKESTVDPEQTICNLPITKHPTKMTQLSAIQQESPKPVPEVTPICEQLDSLHVSESDHLSKMTCACRTILSCIGENPHREGLEKTPERWAKALLFFAKGCHKSTVSVVNDAVFTRERQGMSQHDHGGEMVVVRDIDVHSLCEHHMVPFTRRVHC